MELLTPGSGLIIWQTIIFIALVFILGKLAWKPILGMLKEREESIQTALLSAEQAKLKMASLQADHEKLIHEAQNERNHILDEARRAARQVHEQAQIDATHSANQLIQDAKAVIETEKAAALREVKNLVASLSLDIASRLIKKNLTDDKSHQELIQKYLDDLQVN